MPMRVCMTFDGVTDGTRTRDNRNPVSKFTSRSHDV